MSSISLVVARNSPLGRAQVLQESVNNSVNISNNDVNKNGKREVIIVRKKSKAAPTTVSVTSLIQNSENVTPSVPAKRSRLRDEQNEEQTKAPTPLAVARRNARERNRVRQVNDGFSALRRHIPDEVAEAFENANSNRGPNKKLSKVETLRMAVEYIRNLESLLNIEHSIDKENSCRPSIDSFPSPASSSPRETSQDRSYFMMNSPGLDDEELEDDDIENSFTQLPQFIGLSSHETFQLVSTPHLYEDDDGGPPLTPSSDLLSHEDVNSHLLEGAFQFPNAAEHFSVITDRSFCTDAVGNMNEDFEVKYVDTLQSQAHMIATSAILPLDGLPNNIVIGADEYHTKMESNSYANEYSEIELKKELPDIKVTPEDREQFEETLKWWQEKTKLSRTK